MANENKMKLTKCKVFKDGKLLSDNTDVELPDIAGLTEQTRKDVVKLLVEEIGKEIADTCNFSTVEGGDIREGAIDVDTKVIHE